ncbi:MAG: thioredoxin family protein [Ignavibacteriales bacterium]|nr:thioredoxin family protein [Ignavibacteriales bacterium]
MKGSIAVLFLFLYGCSSTEQYHISVEETGTKIVTGIFERSLLEHDADFKGWYDFRYNEYEIDSPCLREITPMLKGVRFVIVAGTWCGDSKREIPHLLKILDSAKVTRDQILFCGVDRLKKSGDGSTDHYQIDLVPTIILFKDSTEIGRIVERPEETLEKDLRKILQHK